jgi:DNA-binding transcriptional MerR regulator
VEDVSRPVYSIGAVAQMLSMSPATLRSWEDRYGLVVPQRSAGGHRLYSRDQVEQLRFVNARLAEGMHASDAHRLLAQRPRAADPLAPAPNAGPAAEGDRPAILIAERDPYAAGFSDFFLRTEGYEVVSSLTADDAAARFTELSPALAIVELMISGGLGLDLCRTFKSQSPAPVVAVSSLATPDDALAAGADAFLAKPLDPLELVSTVKDLLGSSAFLQSSPAVGQEP